MTAKWLVVWVTVLIMVVVGLATVNRKTTEATPEPPSTQGQVYLDDEHNPQSSGYRGNLIPATAGVILLQERKPDTCEPFYEAAKDAHSNAAEQSSGRQLWIELSISESNLYLACLERNDQIAGKR